MNEIPAAVTSNVAVQAFLMIGYQFPRTYPSVVKPMPLAARTMILR
jgi:hypothetical protein